MPQSARESKMVPLVETKQRRFSDSTMNNTAKCDSQAELNEVFRQANESKAFARGRYQEKPYYSISSHHEHIMSTESQTEEYKEQILRMSKRQFGTSRSHQGKTKNEIR